jgi:hypothetical protein
MADKEPNMDQQSPEKTPGQLVEEYIVYRDEKKRADETYAAWLNDNYTTPMKEIEAKLLDILNKTDASGIKTKAGTAYKKLSTSVTIADMSEFRRHVIGSEQWDLADWRASKTRIEEMLEEGEQLPPGVNRTSFFTVGIRRS